MKRFPEAPSVLFPVRLSPRHTRRVGADLPLLLPFREKARRPPPQTPRDLPATAIEAPQTYPFAARDNTETDRRGFREKFERGHEEALEGLDVRVQRRDLCYPLPTHLQGVFRVLRYRFEIGIHMRDRVRQLGFANAPHQPLHAELKKYSTDRHDRTDDKYANADAQLSMENSAVKVVFCSDHLGQYTGITVPVLHFEDLKW